MICPLVLMKYLCFSMQVLTDQMTFPICKGLVPRMEMHQLHNCQHTWYDLSRSLVNWLKSFNKALKSSHANTEHAPKWLQIACERLQHVDKHSLRRTCTFPLLSSLHTSYLPSVTWDKNQKPLCCLYCMYTLPREGTLMPASLLGCFYLPV